MFKFFVLASLVALAVAQYGYVPGNRDALSQPIPFQYSYAIDGGDGRTGTFTQTRAENGDGNGNVQGSYGYTDSNGNLRHVDYVADANGFRAQIRTNEPGTDNQSPADVVLQAEPPRYQQPAGPYGPAAVPGRPY